MQRPLRGILPFTVACLVLLASSGSAQVVAATVRDSGGRAIPDAVVSLADSIGRNPRRVTTSASGFAEFIVSAPGMYILTARRLGFAAAAPRTVVVGRTDTVRLDVPLLPASVRLAEVEVKSQRNEILHSRIFGMDIRTLGASVITPAEIDAALPGSNDVAELLGKQGVPGLTYDGSRRCITHLVGNCLPVILDGLLISDATSLVDVLPPEAVDYAVYVHSTELGVLYGAVVADNGALLIVTKRGLTRGPGRDAFRPRHRE